MHKIYKYCLVFYLTFIGCCCFSQNENKKWYFGNQAGVDFMTSTPTTLTNSAMNTTEGCASISDGITGSLLFYTDGSTIWDQTHSVMANGSGLNANSSSAQSSLILKKPGSSNLYYVFTQEGQNVYNGGLYCSIVDMSLSSGNGSVTTKNTSLYQPSCEKITATRHCNGTDFWIISHDYNSNVFRTFLLTSAGISTAVVTSTVGTSASNVNLSLGVLKVSSNGKKIGHALEGGSSSGLFELYDFDNSTGIVSNAFILNNTLFSCYCCEFSPDCTKFYGSVASNNAGLYQWDLCAGSATAIAASQTSLYVGSPATWFIQLAEDGKIYTSRGGQTALGVINSPNVAGASCNYSISGPSISPNSALLGLPNFVLSANHPTLQPFTHTVSMMFGCQTASFNAPPLIQTFTTIGCISSGYSVTSLHWNFGDPASGSANTSTLANPSHSFSALATYTTQLIVNYSCGRSADTLSQLVIINQPCALVTSSSISCASLGSATITSIGPGPFSYTWMPSAQNGSVASNLAPGTYTVIIYDAGNNTTTPMIITFTSAPISGTLSTSNSITCYGAATGTASYSGISGGTSHQNYLWTNGTTSFTSANVTSLSAGIWSVTVTDAITGCQTGQNFYMPQPAALTLAISSNTAAACVGNPVALSGLSSGGTPAYTYSWTNGPPTTTCIITQTIGGIYIYTLSGRDANNCLVSNTIAIDFISYPVLSVANISICPFSVGTLTVSGATSYTWSDGSNGNTFTTTTSANQQYTVTGSVLGCVSEAYPHIHLYPLPIPLFNSNSPTCNGQTLQLAGYGGSSYKWNGPANFTSALQNPVINSASPNNSGVYTVTVTSIFGCTATISKALIVYPSPFLSVSSTTVCTSQTLNLNASSNATTFAWSGPQNFSSANQNTFIPNPTTSQSGIYTVSAISIQGCMNTATIHVSVITPPSLFVSFSSGSLCAQALNGSPNTITLTCSGALTYTLETPPYISNTNPGGPSSYLSTLSPYLINKTISTVTITGSNGTCTSSTTSNFTIIPNPVITTNSSFTICEGDSYMYKANGAASYYWSSGIWGLNTYTNSIVVSPSVTSIYSVIGTSLGCNSSIHSNTITVNPLPAFTISPGIASICLGEKITLIANGTGSSYTWAPGTGLNSQTGFSVNASPASQQTYTVTGSLNSCTNSAILTVSVLSLPTPSIYIPKQRVCINELVTLKGFGGQLYAWRGPEGFLYTGQTATFVTNSSANTGMYTLTVTDSSGCKNSTSATLIMDNLPYGNLLGTKMQDCVPFCSNFTFSPTSPNITASWELDHKTISLKTFSYCFTQPGNYIITGNFRDTLSHCINTATYQVNAYPLPKADFVYSPEKPIENMDPVIFINNSLGENQIKWHWYFIDNAGYTSTQENTSYSFDNAGLYPVAMIVANTWGCSDTIVKVVKVEPDFILYVPNVFTPNADSRNEIFLPIVRGAKFYKLLIFNRWGSKIFETNDATVGWDGTFHDTECKSDVYIWKISASGINGEMKDLTGHVTLYR